MTTATETRSRRSFLSNAFKAAAAGAAGFALTESRAPAMATMLNELGWLDVTDYGAVGDNVTLCSNAFDAVMADAEEGDVIYVPPGIYRLSRPIIGKRNVTIRGAALPPRWPYKSQCPSRIKVDTGTWVGEALVVLNDKELTGALVELEGFQLVNIGLDGVAYNSPAVHGIEARGHIQDIQLHNVTIWNVKGNGIDVAPHTRADTTVQICSGWRINQVTVCQAVVAFNFDRLTDSTMTDCLTTTNTGDSYVFANPSDNHIVGCRSVFGSGHGFLVTGNVGNIQFSNCSTDRMQKNGFYMNADDGNNAIIMTGCYARRDGAAGGTYAGLCITPAGANHCPIVVAGFGVHVSKDDNGGGTAGPQYGVRVTGAVRSVVLTSVVAAGTIAGLQDSSGGKLKSAGCQYNVTAAAGLVTTWGPLV